MVQVLLIAAFVCLFLREMLAGPLLPGLDPGPVAAVYLGGQAAVGLATLGLVRWHERRLERVSPIASVARTDATALASRIAALVLHSVAVLGLGWLDVVRGWVGDLVLIDELIAVAPVMAVFVLGWWAVYPIDRRLREAVLIRDLDEGRPIHPMPGRGAYVLSAIRHQAAMAVVPIMLIIAWLETAGWAMNKFIPHTRHQQGPPWEWALGAQLVGLALVLTMMPVVMRHVWRTEPLGAGSLRDSLAAMCRRQRVRVRELLVWVTHGTMINGAVMGFVGPLRYILLTDALLDSLPQEQVEAVMAHELGHVKRRHMLWLGIAAISAITLSHLGLNSLTSLTLGQRVTQSDAAQAVISLAALAIGMLIFGFISRRFEWQADAFAVQHLSAVGGGEGTLTEQAGAAMRGALEAVARLNRIPRERFTWRHGSIAERQRRLAALPGQRADSLAVDRAVRRWKLVAAVALAVTAAALVRDASRDPALSEAFHALREDARDR